MTMIGENAKTLAMALGITEDEATELLAATIVITFSHETLTLAEEVVALLSRTVTCVATSQWATTPSLEIVIGQIQPRTQATKLFVSSGSDAIMIDTKPSDQVDRTVPHPLFSCIGACYIAAAAAQQLLGVGQKIRYPLAVELSQLGIRQDELEVGLEIGETYLAGAGAIGNAFLRALRHLTVRGLLHIADPDIVSDGNLNRCLWFEPDDVGMNKALILATKAQSSFTTLTLKGHNSELAKLDIVGRNDAWLERLIVGVDSRRARRHLQGLAPREVFDASTTGIAEVIVHHHVWPTEHACMACIYSLIDQEHAHEKHVAESLNVSLSDVSKNQIDENAASLIVQRYPHLTVDSLVGEAYDSLFKTLCGTQVLKGNGDKQVLAPFAFVSALAGALLAVELVRRFAPKQVSMNDNYWRATPWSPPNALYRRLRPRIESCSFCGDSITRQIATEIWATSASKRSEV